MKWFNILILFFPPYFVFAQKLEKDTLYYNQNWDLTIKNEAKYCRIVSVNEGYYNGEFIDIYLANGSIVSCGQYEKGLLSGKYIEKDTSGCKIIDGFYDKGIRKGIWSFYYNTGKLNIQIDYSGEKPKINEFYDKNNIHTLINGNGFISYEFIIIDREYILRGEIHNGLNEGKWTYLNKNDNTKFVEEKYSKGRFIYGENFSKKIKIIKPFLSIDNLFFSNRLYITDHYTVSGKNNIFQIPKVTRFYSNIDDNFCLLDSLALKGFPSGEIKKICVDKYGNLWFEADKLQGLYCIKNGSIKNYKAGVVIQAINADCDGEIWVPYEDVDSYDKSGLLRIKSDSVYDINVLNSALTCNYIHSIYSKNDSIIIGAHNCINIYNKKTNKWSVLNTPRIHKSKFDTIQIKNYQQYMTFRAYNSRFNYYRNIIKYNNNIWVGTFHGLYALNGKNMILYQESNNNFIKSNWISSLNEYDSGLMISFDGKVEEGGITFLKNGSWNNLNSGNSILTNNKIYNAVVGTDGEIWLHYDLRSLAMFDNGRTIVYGCDYNKYLINDITIDSNGNLYVATDKGILVKFKETYK